MQDQTNAVIYILPFAERLMTTFMGDDPYACTHGSLRSTQASQTKHHTKHTNAEE